MFNVRDYSITKKLTRMNMLVTGAALLIACVAFVAYDVVTFRQSMVHNLSIQAQMAGSNSVSPLLFNDPQAAENTLSALTAAPNVGSAGIYTLEGRPFATYWRDGNSENLALPQIPSGQTEAHWFKDGQLILVRNIVFQGKPTGTVYIRSDLQEMSVRLKRYAGIAAIVLLASLIPALLVASRFQRAVVEPIVHLAGIARTVSRDKSYSMRATPTGNRDEPDILIQAFNEMLGQIQERDGALQKAHDELEQRVEERTTQLRAAHGELQRTNAELTQLTLDLEDRVAQRAESEEKFRNLSETAAEAIISADSSGKIVYCNPAAERIFCYSSTDIIGQALTLLMPERFQVPHREGFDRFLKTGEARVIGKTVELAGRRKNGSEFPMELSLSSWKTREGTFFTAILSDITERKQAEESLERHRLDLAQSNAKLAAANQELETFSYSVSHDLRAPLRSIDGFSQALLEDCAEKLDDKDKNHLLRVRAATQRMGELIDDLLNLSRVTRTEMRREKIDLSAVARSITAELERTQPSRQVNFVIEEGLQTRADPHLLRIVLENLLGNAWKFTSKRASACIEFAKTRCDGATAYFVRDDGAGFDPIYARRLFGPFQRLHGSTEFPGTGIGLATVQRIIHRHGGKIWAEGAVEKGATFYFTL